MKLTLGLLLFAALLLGQAGWQTLKDKTGACQISLPPAWTILSNPGAASSPEHMLTAVRTGLRPYRPWSVETLTMLNIDKLVENSATRSFYVTKPTGNRALVNYHVEVPGAGNSCIAQITASASYAQDARKIGQQPS